MKIAHIVDSLRGGGIQNFLLSLLPEQVALGHEITLFVVEQYDYEYCYHLDKILVDNGVNTVCLNKKQANKYSFLTTNIKFRKLLPSVNPEVLNSHGPMSHMYATMATKCTSIKHCCTVHSSYEPWNPVLKMLCRKTPLIFCSDSAFEFRLQSSDKMRAINNGVSPNIVKTDKCINLREELGLLSTDKIVLLVGSLRPEKNYEFLKEIVAELNDSSIHFCICGGNYGVGYISIDDFADYPTIHCLGLRDDISALENGSDLFLSCSKYEGLPISVLEAYFNGIPCVLSPIPQHKDISDVDYVWMPKDFTAIEFSKTILAALECTINHSDIYKIRESQLERFAIKSTAEKYITFYKEII